MKKVSVKKFLLYTVAVLLVMALSIAGTLAYLQSESETWTNEFKTNKVTVSLKEEHQAEPYNIIPGTEQQKDPKVTVDNSIPAYVYFQVTDTTEGLVTWAPASGWTLLEGTTDVYVRSVGAEDAEKTFSVLAGDKVSYADSLTNEDMKKLEGKEPKLIFKAFAIQQQPFANEVEAWTQIPTQVANEEELQDALNSAFPGKPIKLTAGVTANEPLKVTKPGTVLDLNGKTIAPKAEGIWTDDNWSLITVNGPDAELTINGNGKFATKPDDSYAVDVQNGGKLTINGGEFVGNIHAVYVYEGELTVNGGKFSVQQQYPDSTKAYEFTLNCYDENYRNGTAKIMVTGGSFYNFDPTNCKAEGADTNFTPYGYTAEQGEDGYYTVVPKPIERGYDLIQAAKNAKDGDTILVNKDFTLFNPISFEPTETKKITIDLNGHKAKRTTSWLMYAGEKAGTEITIKNGELETSANGLWLEDGVKLTLEDVKLTAGNYAVYALANTDATVVLKDCEITSNGFCVGLWGKENNVTIENTTINANDCGIYQNGNCAPATFNLRNVTINTTGVGVYISNTETAQKQTLNIENCNVTGVTAVEVKHTNATIKNSTLTATATEKTAKEAGSGSCTTGYSLAVTSNGIDESATGTVTVTGGSVGDVFVYTKAEGASVTIDGTEIAAHPDGYYTPKN